MGKKRKKSKKIKKAKSERRGGFPIRMKIPPDARITGDFMPYQERHVD